MPALLRRAKPRVAFLPASNGGGAGQLRAMCQSIDGAAFHAGGRGQRHRSQAGEQSALATQIFRMFQRVQGPLAQMFGAMLGHMPQHV